MDSNIFELTFEKAAIGIAHLDASGKWIRVNQQLCNFLGYSREELLSLTFQDITYKDDLEFDLFHTKKLYEGLDNTFTIEKRYIRKDGTPTWAQLSASVVRDEKGEVAYFISVIADINEQKHLEYEKNKALNDLKFSNQKYKEINDNLKKAEQIAKLGNWSLNILENKLAWSDEIFNIFEIDQKQFEATYEAFVARIHPDDREIVHTTYIRSLEIRENYKIIHRLLMNDGRIKYVMEQCKTTFDEDGKPLYSIGTVQDITEVRNAQLQLIESEQFYRTIVSSIDKGILILENNSVIDCNETALSLFETTEEKFIGTNIIDSTRTIECSIESFETHLSNAYQGHAIREQCTLILHENVKMSKVLEITLATYGNNADKLIMLTRDITQKLEEEKIFKMHTRQAQMGEMISMIAHQWRQPLAIINAIASQLRLKEMMKDDEDSNLLDSMIKIEQQSLHLSQTITDYRDFFRPDKPLETIQLSDLIVHTLDLIDHTMKSKGVTIQKIVRFPSIVKIYRNEVLQVLITLLKNSFDAFEENNIHNRQINIEVDQDKNFGIIVIKDNAGGISENVLGKIFVPYFTTKGHSYGTGLGLYMSKTIVEEHCHGKLDISSCNNETTITIKFPLLTDLTQ